MSGSFVTPTSELGVVKRVKTHTNPRSWYSRKEVVTSDVCRLSFGDWLSTGRFPWQRGEGGGD